MKRALSWLALACLVAAPFASRADAVAEWNRIALQTVVRTSWPVEDQLRAMAIVHAAMFETLNFIEGRYPSRLVVARSDPLQGISLEAAAAAAAHHVLLELCPDQSEALDAAWRASLNALADPHPLPAGITGRSIAAIVWAFAPRPAGKPAARQPRAGSSPHGDPLSWNSVVAELIAARGLPPLEAARIHALTAAAVADSYAALAAAVNARKTASAGPAKPQDGRARSAAP